MKTTEENNKLIAEFMGNLKRYNTLGLTVNKIQIGGKLYKAVDLKYHTSWDWLMPVVEKCLIGEAEADEETSMTTIKAIYEALCNTSIQEVHKAVVKFIEGQNTNNQ